MSNALYELQVHSVSSVYAFMYMCAYLVKFKMLSGKATGTVCTYVHMYMYLICTFVLTYGKLLHALNTLL